MLRDWSFGVECPTLFGEVACVTGSCPQLGNWNPDQVNVHVPILTRASFCLINYP